MMFSVHLDTIFAFWMVYLGRFEWKPLCLSITALRWRAYQERTKPVFSGWEGISSVGRLGSFWLVSLPALGGQPVQWWWQTGSPTQDPDLEINLGRHCDHTSQADRPHALLLSVGSRQGPRADALDIGKTGAQTLSILLRERIRINTQLFDNLYFHQWVFYFLSSRLEAFLMAAKAWAQAFVLFSVSSSILLLGHE